MSTRIRNYIIHLASTGVYKKWWVISLSSDISTNNGSLVFYTHKNTILDVEDIIYKMIIESPSPPLTGLGAPIDPDGHDESIFRMTNPELVINSDGVEEVVSSIILDNSGGVELSITDAIDNYVGRTYLNNSDAPQTLDNMSVDFSDMIDDVVHEDIIMDMIDEEFDYKSKLQAPTMSPERKQVLEKYLTDRGIGKIEYDYIMLEVNVEECADWRIDTESNLVLLGHRSRDIMVIELSK